MHRRDFLRLSGAGCLGMLGPAGRQIPLPSAGRIVTVRGPIAPDRFGSALSHEHVLVDFVGADRVSPARYDANEVYDVVLPHLQAVRGLGCRGFVECTPAYLGRDPRLLERLASATDLHIVTNTGYYGAAKHQYVPRHAYDESADQLADRWVREWQDGIEGTGIRPGFIKTGVDAGPLTRRRSQTPPGRGQDARAHRAAHCVAHREHARCTGATGRPRCRASARERLHLGARAERLDPRVAGRCRCERGLDRTRQRGRGHRRGKRRARDRDEGPRASWAACWLSHDAGWYRPGEPRGGRFRGFETVYTAFVPALRRAGWTPDDMSRLLEANPAAAFTIRPRLGG